VHRVSVSYDNVLQKHVSRKMRGISWLDELLSSAHQEKCCTVSTEWGCP
jgi:hypothetical protein